MSEVKLLKGNSFEKLKELEANSIDSVVTDPPYMLEFMGKDWDKEDSIAGDPEFWKEVYRVLKPGGHLLSFGGSRTYHRIAIAIEDAGFEIRDQIQWLYGSGFPKSHNIGKAYDEKMGNERIKVERPKEDQRPNADNVRAEDGKVGKFGMSDNKYTTVGNSEWEGWGTALKPAHEPICMARKPFDGTVVDNVTEWGTGGINIDDSRIETTDSLKGGIKPGTTHEGWDRPFMHDEEALKRWEENKKASQAKSENLGRFPANVILDEEAGRILDEQSGESTSGAYKGEGSKSGGIWSESTGKPAGREYGDTGGASRFFYCPKASKDDRDEGLEMLEDKLFGQSGGAQQALREGKDEYQKKGESSTGLNTIKKRKNHHPTVKPTDLMKYLIKLVTPPNGTVLDPFMGSGSTGKAAKQLGFNFVGIEREDDYFEIAEVRIATAMEGTDKVVAVEQQEKINKFFDL